MSAPLAQRLSAVALSTWAIGAVAAILLVVFPYQPAVRSPNELCRLFQTRALVDFGTPEINQVLRMYGGAGDLSVMREPDGPHYFPSKAPLLSYLAVPIYWLLEQVRGGAEQVGEVALVFFARLFCTVLPAVLLLFPLRRFLVTVFDDRVAAALLVIYGAGTIAFPYAELFMSHGLTAVLLFLVFYLLWRHGRGELGERALIAAGLLAGASVATEYTAALALLPLAVYGYSVSKGPKGRVVGLALAGVLPAVLFLAWYHQRCFGSPFETGYKHLNDPGYQGWHTAGFLGITIPDPRALFLSFFSPLRGLFILSPALLLALPGMWLLKQREDLKLERRLVWALLGLYTYFTSSFSYDSWGWTTGPRHMTPLVPFLLLPLGAFLAAAPSRKGWPELAVGLGLLSVVITALLTQLNYISDCLRNGVDRLAFPLFLGGFLPSTWLSLVGVPNPWAWLPEGLALAAGLGLIAWTAGGASAGVSARGGVLGAVLFAVYLGIPSGPPTECESATLHNVERDYLPQPGTAMTAFWSPPSFSMAGQRR